MGVEIEAKMRLQDAASLEARLTALGARRGPVIDEINRFFDTPDHALRRGGQGLRVRTEKHSDKPEPDTIITHKGPQSAGELKTRPETELGVTNAADAVKLLEALGYVCTLTFEKRRRRWFLDDCQVEMDSLPDLGDYVEIEGPSEQQVLALRKKLGMEREPLIRESYAALVAKQRGQI